MSTPNRADPQTDAYERYSGFMEVVSNRITTRQFNPDYVVPGEHYDLILEAARHGPSGANSQPWHYIVVADPQVKQEIADYFVSEQQTRIKLNMKFPTPNYAGLATAPGFIVVATDFRWVRAFPVLQGGEDEGGMYLENAERILLQSVAAATMSAHLAAAALGYNVWWVTAIGQQRAQEVIKPLLGIPDELAILDLLLFGPPLKPVYKRWKRDLDEIRSWDRFNMDNFMTDAELDDWIANQRHRVMYKDEKLID